MFGLTRIQIRVYLFKIIKLLLLLFCSGQFWIFELKLTHDYLENV